MTGLCTVGCLLLAVSVLVTTVLNQGEMKKGIETKDLRKTQNVVCIYTCGQFLDMFSYPNSVSTTL